MSAPSANFNSYTAQDGFPSQDGDYPSCRARRSRKRRGYKAATGWRFGNLIDAQAGTCWCRRAGQPRAIPDGR